MAQLILLCASIWQMSYRYLISRILLTLLLYVVSDFIAVIYLSLMDPSALFSALGIIASSLSVPLHGTAGRCALLAFGLPE